ncbi:MAG: hypothetical protein Q9217_003755 [Psora testacea]
MDHSTESVPVTKLNDLESHTEPLLVQGLSIDDPNGTRKTSRTTYFAGLSVNVTTGENGASREVKGICPTTFSGELTSSSTLEFDAPVFSFTQQANEVHIPEGITPIPVHTIGEIEVRPAQKRLRSRMEVDFTLSVAGDGVLSTALFSGIHQDGSSLNLTTPKQLAPNVPFNPSQIIPCVRIYATIWVARGTFLENFNIASESLIITMHPDLDFSTSRTSISAMSGSVSILSDSPTAFASRETIIKGGDSSITGKYPLYDLLSITTTSGSIDVTVLPQDVSLTVPQPAELKLATSSGSLRSRVSKDSVPNRNYTNFISSYNGKVDVTLLHGNSTTIRTASGPIYADIYPYGFNGSRTIIDTRSQSGQVDVTLYPSLSNPGDILNNMFINHRSISGRYFFEALKVALSKYVRSHSVFVGKFRGTRRF